MQPVNANCSGGIAERRGINWIFADNYLIQMWNRQQTPRYSSYGRGRPIRQPLPAPSGERIVYTITFVLRCPACSREEEQSFRLAATEAVPGMYSVLPSVPAPVFLARQADCNCGSPALNWVPISLVFSAPLREVGVVFE